MQVVIEINDNLYTRLFDNGVDNYNDAVDMAKAIRKGTTLPEKHGDLVDVKEVEEYLNNIQLELDGWGDTDSAVEIAKARIGLDTITKIIKANKGE